MIIVIKEKETVYFSYNVYQTIYTNLSLETISHPDNTMVCRLYHHPNSWLLVDDDIFVRDLFKHSLVLPEEVSVLSIQNELIPQMKTLLEFYNIKHPDTEKSLPGNYILIHENRVYSISVYQYVKEIQTYDVIGQYDSIIMSMLNYYKDLEVSEKVDRIYQFLNRAYHLYIPSYELISLK